MANPDPVYDYDALGVLCDDYLRKSDRMKEICDSRHDTAIKVNTWRNRLTLGASITVLCLTFFGTDKIISVSGFSASTVTILFSIASLALVLTSVWQLTGRSGDDGYVNYKAVQDFASISNKIRYIKGSTRMDDETATIWAKWIIQEYDEAASDVHGITDDEYEKAKNRSQL